MSRVIHIIIYTLLFYNIGVAQLDNTEHYYYPEFKTEADNNLYFRLENNNFVKNNEYFSNHIEGYTLMGYTAQPSFVYYAGSRFRVKAGLQLIQYSGINNFTDVWPVFSAHTKLSDNLDLVLGALKGNVHHRLIEPIFNPENIYSRPVETGMQFLFQKEKLWVDIWVDWEQFIFLGDSIPEKFTAGLSSEFNMNKPESDWQISIPVQMIVTHTGGQISNYPEHMQSLANIVSGLKVKYHTGNGFIKNIGLATYIAGYKDLTEKSDWDFHNGSGIYPVTEVAGKNFTFMGGYWHAHNFIAPKGNYLFQSTSNFKQGYYTPYRDMITTKFRFSKTLMKKVKFSATFETYYDIPESQFDYSYGINIVFNPDFFISKIQFE